MATRRAKRFYEQAEAVETAKGCAVHLDGRPVKTPGGAPLVLPAPALAEAVAEEWEAQGETVDPASMPMTGLASTAIDRLGPERRPAVEQELLSLAASELLCYRAEAPRELVDLQEATWQPLLDWAAETFGARLRVTQGILPTEQPASALSALDDAVKARDRLSLAGTSLAVSASGSLLIGLALSHGRLDGEAAFEAAELDSLYQMRTWGEEREALARHRLIRADLDAAARWRDLLTQDAW